ncbi:seryl-tRNA ligase [Hyphomonas polymorpha PS728]|uniref:Serine--tRNA ligase n=1 Tax=Hyphomonas polymorpha PS728 TaxID=1280954 RepID=A0A062VLZ6_9PROT|nr:serine--tRNA ligase [Hyphomonas polymorpha]KCZ99208.1 seryl-tRNA ligase [Hyphomonas polymorpha PS728]
MFDIRAIRENPDLFIRAWNRRKEGLGSSSVAKILELDKAWREATTAKQDAESARNANSKLIGQAKAKKDEAEAERLMALVAEAKTTIEQASEAEETARKALDDLLMGLPNLPLDEVPEGSDEHGNVEQHKWGTPKGINAPKDHADLGEALKGQGGFPLMDFEAAARMSGARFVALRGKLTRLERALANFMLDLQTTEHGYEEVSPPLLVRDQALLGTGQLPKFEEDLFHTNMQSAALRDSLRRASDEFISLSEKRNNLLKAFVTAEDTARTNGTDTSWTKGIYQEFAESLERTVESHKWFQTQFDGSQNVRSTAHYLIPTAEVPLTNLVREQIIESAQLPLRFTAHTPCFRSEAGSAGRDTKGMIRQHQFNKVELVSIVANEEEGLKELERMTGCAEEVLKRLELPFRRMLLCTGDMGAGARKTYDLEVWLPSQNTYREISSCSYCGDFQARRMDARYRPEPKAKPEYVHTLNGSGLAVGRTLVAVLENYQNADGSITVPKALVPYMGGVTEIK